MLSPGFPLWEDGVIETVGLERVQVVVVVVGGVVVGGVVVGGVVVVVVPHGEVCHPLLQQ